MRYLPKVDSAFKVEFENSVAVGKAVVFLSVRR
jgi:hypothetical protein